MEIIEVVEGGFFTTVQDLGRYGYQRYGVPVSGAMDSYGLRMANILLGNEEGAAALEMTLVGPKLKFLEDTVIALAGANLRPRLNGDPVSTWSGLRVRKGSLLSFDGPQTGVKCYLAAPGGIGTPVVMGSRSTYARGKLGGYEGRALKPGDILSSAADVAGRPIKATKLPQRLLPDKEHQHLLRVVMGPQADAFTAEGVSVFLSSDYTVSRQSDRMGYRLEGPVISHKAGADIISDGAPLGAVQVTGDGLPVVLMADRGATGGYAKIATVISVDVGKLAQSLPGDKVSFRAVTVEEAHQRLREQEADIQEFKEEVARSKGEAEATGGLQPSATASPRRSVTATINGRSHTFEVEIVGEEPAPARRGSSGRGTAASSRTVSVTVNGRSYTFEVEEAG